MTLAATPAATTYTIIGLALDTGTATGPVNADATAGPCSALSPQSFTPNVRLATVGSVNQIGGANRYATAGLIANEVPDFDNLAGRTVVIARGDNFPDALAASYLAGQNNVPILLTTPSSVPAETVATLRRDGVTDVVLVGGTTSITPAVATFLAALPTYPADQTLSSPATGTHITVTRVGGTDRYDTAKAVAELPGLAKAGTVGIKNGTTCAAQKTAILASGRELPGRPGGRWARVRGRARLWQRPAAAPAHAQERPDARHGQRHHRPGDQADPAHGRRVRRSSRRCRRPWRRSLGSPSSASPARPGRTRPSRWPTTVLGQDAIGKWNGGGFLLSRPDTFPDALTASSLSGVTLAPLYLAASSTDFGTINTTGVIGYPYPYGKATLIGGTTSLNADVLTAAAKALAVQPTDLGPARTLSRRGGACGRPLLASGGPMQDGRPRGSATILRGSFRGSSAGRARDC